MYQILAQLIMVFINFIKTLFKSKEELILENLALRHQLGVYQTKKAKPGITILDRSFWITLKLSWCKWVDYLIIVKPETGVEWQNRKFKKYWTKISTKDKKPGKKSIKKEIHDLIYQMTGEN
jgi:hypothetical protein